MEPLARVQFGPGAPAELLRLMPLLGIEPEIDPHTIVRLAKEERAPAFKPAPQSSGRPNLRVDFGEVRGLSSAVVPSIRIAMTTRSRAENIAFDLAADNARSAACFILSRALGLPSPFLTVDSGTFEIIRAALAVARGPARILIEGDTGSGKEALVKLVHAARGDPASLVQIDCPASDETTIEAELAERVAAANRPPDSAAPQRLTVFFKQMSELSTQAQVAVFRLMSSAGHGSTCSAGSGLRFLASSTAPLGQMVERGSFLSELHDLFDVTLMIPPLRLRLDDISMLARYYLRTLNPVLTFSPAALKELTLYRFPGNVRELINLMTRLVIVPLDNDARTIGRAVVSAQLGSGISSENDGQHSIWKLSQSRARRELVQRALAAADGDAEAAAVQLGISAGALLRLTTVAIPRPKKPRRGRHPG